MKKIIFLIIPILCSCSLFFNSSDDDKSDEKHLLNRTVLVYMVADNNLDNSGKKDINNMEKAWDPNNDGKLLVLMDRNASASTSHPVLLEIIHDTSDQIKSKVLNVYQETNILDTNFITARINEVVSFYPSINYGLVFWSHGTGWLSPDFNSTELQNKHLEICKSFGEDDGKKIGIIELEKSIPTKMEFIIFDACYMGCIEVAYQLRNKADKIIFSPTEVLSYGFCYEKTIPLLYEKNIKYENVIDTVYSFYQNMEGAFQSLSISLINSCELENLAKEVFELFSKNDSILKIETSGIQEYAVYNNLAGYFYDFYDVFETSFNFAKISKYDLDKINNITKKVILKEKHTEKLLDLLSLEKICGVSMYVCDSAKSKINDYYKKLDWCKDSNYETYF